MLFTLIVCNAELSVCKSFSVPAKELWIQLSNLWTPHNLAIKCEHLIIAYRDNVHRPFSYGNFIENGLHSRHSWHFFKVIIFRDREWRVSFEKWTFGKKRENVSFWWYHLLSRWTVSHHRQGYLFNLEVIFFRLLTLSIALFDRII